ncbi:hypothetical protein [Bosea vaviloviae]|nr:hypothetical protein [Bosea vaviloviae]
MNSQTAASDDLVAGIGDDEPALEAERRQQIRPRQRHSPKG